MRARICLMTIAMCFAMSVLQAQNYYNERVHKEPTIGSKMAAKWARGVGNTLTGVVEIPAQIVKGKDRGVGLEKHPKTDATLGGTVGIFNGIYHAVGRTGTGIFEILTFWAVNPETNSKQGIHLDAHFANSDADETQKPFFASRDVNEDDKVTRRMGQKFTRGGMNTLAGVMDVPYHVKAENAKQDGNVVKGVAVGTYGWVSREVNGVWEMATFLLPNPDDQVGPEYATPKPWVDHKEFNKKK